MMELKELSKLSEDYIVEMLTKLGLTLTLQYTELLGCSLMIMHSKKGFFFPINFQHEI